MSTSESSDHVMLLQHSMPAGNKDITVTSKWMRLMASRVVVKLRCMGKTLQQANVAAEFQR